MELSWPQHQGEFGTAISLTRTRPVDVPAGLPLHEVVQEFFNGLEGWGYCTPEAGGLVALCKTPFAGAEADLLRVAVVLAETYKPVLAGAYARLGEARRNVKPSGDEALRRMWLLKAVTPVVHRLVSEGTRVAVAGLLDPTVAEFIDLFGTDAWPGYRVRLVDPDGREQAFRYARPSA